MRHSAFSVDSKAVVLGLHKLGVVPGILINLASALFQPSITTAMVCVLSIICFCLAFRLKRSTVDEPTPAPKILGLDGKPISTTPPSPPPPLSEKFKWALSAWWRYPLTIAGSILFGISVRSAYVAWGEEEAWIVKMFASLIRIEETTATTQGQVGRMETRQIDDSDRLQRVEQQNEDIATWLRELFADKKPGEDPTREQLSPDLIELAKLLRERGNEEQRATAEIALKHHAEADAIIQRLKQAPLAETHRLLTMEGDNWYRAGEFDRAIDPYEKALALRPDHFTTRNNVTVARVQARLSDIAAHRRRAIEVAEGTLQRLSPGSTDWATTQNNLGAAWADLPTGDRAANVQRAIECFEAALTVYTFEAHPVDWAGMQNNLGIAWAVLAEHRPAERCELLRRAIACGKGAMEVLTTDAFPREHGSTSKNLGIVREVYERAGCESEAPFDDIEPAR